MHEDVGIGIVDAGDGILVVRDSLRSERGAETLNRRVGQEYA